MGNACGCDKNNSANNDNAMGRMVEQPFAKDIIRGSIVDRANGCIIGALVGNAYGSYTDNSK